MEKGRGVGWEDGVRVRRGWAAGRRYVDFRRVRVAWVVICRLGRCER